jgi:hypothetical protein
MLVEFVSGFAAAPQSGAASSGLMAFPRVVVVLLLLLVGALVLFYGKALCGSNWKGAVSSTPAVAWVLAKFEKDPVHSLDKGAVEKLAKDHRLNMDSVAARRLSRDMFLATHSEFDFNVPRVRKMLLF